MMRLNVSVLVSAFASMAFMSTFDATAAQANAESRMATDVALNGILSPRRAPPSRPVVPVQGRDPVVTELRNGRLEAKFRSGCRILFDRRGRAVDARRCSRAQESRAKNAVDAHLRRHGRRNNRGRRGPVISERRNGRLEVKMQNKCTMLFSRRGRPIDASNCTKSQERRAKEAVTSYLRSRR